MFFYFFFMGMFEEVVDEMANAYWAAEYARVVRMNQECTKAV